MAETQVVTTEIMKKTEEAALFLQGYDKFEIITADAYSSAGADLRLIKSRHKELETLRKSLTKPLDESKKGIMDFFRLPLSQLKDKESVVSSAMIAWAREQERIRKAEEDRLREVQSKEAARLAKLAANAQARGDTKKMDKFDQRAEDISFAAPVVVPKTTKIAGLAQTKTWKYRIVDLAKLPREYMMPNEKMLGQLARTNKGLFKVDGVEFYYEESVRGTRI